MTSYLVVIVLFAVPVAIKLFMELVYPDSIVLVWIRDFLFTSPFAATFSLPLRAGLTIEAVNQGVKFIREGTIINAILIGQYIKLYFFLFKKWNARKAAPASATLETAAE